LTIPPDLDAEMTPAVRAFVKTLLARIEALEDEVAELKRRLGQTPENSSRPPSTEHPHAKTKSRKKPSGRKRGGQPGHERHQRSLVPPEQVTETVVLRPKRCRRCGGALGGDDPEPVRHQVFELPEIQPIITEYQRHRLACPGCGVRTLAPLPVGVPTGQSGPRLVACAALLMAYFRQSRRRTALFLETLLNLPSSSGHVVKLQSLATDALRPCYDELQAALPEADAVALDETATKQANRKAWLWTAVAKDFTLFAVRDNRRAEVAKQLLGEDFAGVVTSDRYGGYDWIERRQLCWAHLKRDFQSLVDAGGKAESLGRKLLDLTGKLFHHWHRQRDGTVTRATMRRRLRSLWWPVYEALEEGALTLRGKLGGMCQHILDRSDHLWTFLEHPDVEPTNNASERALRHAVIWRKTSFGTQSPAGSRFVETLLSVIETCRQQQRDVFAFVTRAVQAQFHRQPHETLLTSA
jgi:transposase